MKVIHFFVLIVLCLFIGGLFGAPVKNDNILRMPSFEALNFMKKFGYLEDDDGNSEALYTDEGISDAIKEMQRFGAIPETGFIDNATVKLFSTPRCGVPDKIRNKRSKRYILGPEGWKKRTITYFLANWTPKLGEQVVMKNIQSALDTWGKYGRLTFRRAPTPDADIIVAFGSGYHGDRFPFDGPGNILAHAFYPYEMANFGGDIHFDDDEKWTDGADVPDGTDFLSVALHELGHSLGLAHSIAPSAIMFPYYRGYDVNKRLQLDYDDILGIYELYIRRSLPGDQYTTESFDYDTTTNQTTITEYYPRFSTTTEPYRPTRRTSFPHTSNTNRTSDPHSTTTEYYRPRDRYSTTEYYATRDPYTTTGYESTGNPNTTVTYHGDDETVDVHKEHDPTHGIPKTSSPSLPEICNGRFDAVATLRSELFIFKDEYIWRLKTKGKVIPGYPVLLSSMFPLPKHVKKIDAAYERSDGNIILFTGNTYWVFNGNRFVENSPRRLGDYGLPYNLDSIDAVQIWGKNRKTYFYKHNRFWRYNETIKQMDPGYPRHINVWRRIPEFLDAATTWIDGQTYFFKDDLYWTFDNEWVIATDNSPLPAPQTWLGCPEDEKKMVRFLE